jgi:ferrous iron transport protein B
MVAIIVAAIFKKTIFKGMSAPFVMELPPYRIPTAKGAIIHMWERGALFLKKAGTIILALSLVIWALSSLPVGVEYGSQESFTGQIGTVLSPIFAPLGFGEWQATVAIIYGFMAKEVVVSTFGTLYGIGGDGGGEEAPAEGSSSAGEEVAPEENPGFITVMRELFTPLSAYAYMVFVLLYIPCLAALTVIKRETNSWKWPGFAAVYTFVVAYGVSLVIYQGGLLLGF